MPFDQVDVLFLVIRVFEDMGVPYVIGGSFASSAHGLARATMDIDLLVAIEPEQAPELSAKLGSDFYADDVAIRRAALAKRSFNLIHLETSYKVDVFVARPNSFDNQQLNRRRQVVVDEAQRTAYVTTAEDIILVKLRWYRSGNEISERQWRDVVSVIEVQGMALDIEYLREWAGRMELSDLLVRAFAEAGGQVDAPPEPE